MPADRPLRLILDASAIRAFLAGSVDIGEPLALLLEEGSAFGVVVTTLADVWLHATKEQEPLLDVLINHVAYRSVAVEVGDLGPLLTWTGHLDDVELASAGVLALRTGAFVLTRTPRRYHDDQGIPDWVIGTP